MPPDVAVDIIRGRSLSRGKHVQSNKRELKPSTRVVYSLTTASPGFDESRAIHSRTGLLVTTAPSIGTGARRRGKATMSVISGDARASRISCSMLLTASDAPSTSTVPGDPAQRAAVVRQHINLEQCEQALPK